MNSRVLCHVGRAVVHLARSELGQELDALQLAHHRVPQPGSELAQDDIANGVGVA
jgi:hypothetical protein